MSLKLNSNSINYNVATVLDLTSIVNPSINDTVVVTEEGREGVFIYRADGTSNGGTIFDSSSTGKWHRQYEGSVNVKWFGAKGDGVTDDTLAIQSALNLGGIIHLENESYLISQTLTLTEGTTLRGSNSLNYAFATQPASVILVKNNTTTTGIHMLENSNIYDLAITPSNMTGISYTNSSFPTGTGISNYGIIADESNNIDNITVLGFAVAGILAGTTVKIFNCTIKYCSIGINCTGTDGWIKNSTLMFCIDAGAITSNYWNVSGNRFEWNARVGLKSGGEALITTNLFDRNGWAGIECTHGAWGQVITGNYFSRNGCGGDGNLGRWNFSTPSNNSYVPTTELQSCHIYLDYIRRATITGNRFRAGADDSGGGSVAPYYNISTPNYMALGAITINSNEGCTDGDGCGYNSTLYSGLGKNIQWFSSSIESCENGKKYIPTIEATTIASTTITSTNSKINCTEGVLPTAKLKLFFNRASAYGATIATDSLASTGMMYFVNGASSDGTYGTIVGGISTSGSSTSYSTSSDYRLKENIEGINNPIERIKLVKPVNFSWKLDGKRVDGFLAHELQEVIPEAVVGNKDEIDENNKPIYQSIDQSKIVPLLTAALQEAIARIEVLESKLEVNQ